MLQQYLLIDKDINTIEKNILEKYNDVIIEKKELSKTEKIAILSISYLGDNISNAKKLSLIDEYLEQFNPTILENDAACFFETKMYPLFNEFEQKLRKILYLFAAKNYDSEKNTKENESSKKKGTEIADKIKISIKNINGLDKFEFGNIFQVLFVDDNMIADVQKYVGENKQQLSKKELIEKIEQAEEKTFWKDFIGDTAAITLQEMFNSVRLYRNDVMHTHNIRYDTYSKASKLIFKINNELEDEISKLLNSTNVFVKDDFNDRLISKINMLNQLYVGEIRIPSTYAPDNKLIGLKYDSINNQYVYTPSIISTKDKSEFSINSILNNYCNNGFTTIKYDNSDKIFTNKNIENCDKEDFLTLRVDRYGNVNIVPDETSNSK